jgi:hypothetical protein
MDTRTQEFLAHVQEGGQVEVHDWMPDEYRARLVNSSRCTATPS